eukprot:3712325-Rhodomonas_salina.3
MRLRALLWRTRGSRSRLPASLLSAQSTTSVPGRTGRQPHHFPRSERCCGSQQGLEWLSVKPVRHMDQKNTAAFSHEVSATASASAKGKVALPVPAYTTPVSGASGTILAWKKSKASSRRLPYMSLLQTVNDAEIPAVAIDNPGPAIAELEAQTTHRADKQDSPDLFALRNRRPLVDDQLLVDPHAHAAVGVHAERIHLGVQRLHIACPTRAPTPVFAKLHVCFHRPVLGIPVEIQLWVLLRAQESALIQVFPDKVGSEQPSPRRVCLLHRVLELCRARDHIRDLVLAVLVPDRVVLSLSGQRFPVLMLKSAMERPEVCASRRQPASACTPSARSKSSAKFRGSVQCKR